MRMRIVAAPRFLAQLRAVLPKSLDLSVAAEVRKDLVHATDAVIRQQVPREAFASVVG